MLRQLQLEITLSIVNGHLLPIGFGINVTLV